MEVPRSINSVASVRVLAPSTLPWRRGGVLAFIFSMFMFLDKRSCVTQTASFCRGPVLGLVWTSQFGAVVRVFWNQYATRSLSHVTIGSTLKPTLRERLASLQKRRRHSRSQKPFLESTPAPKNLTFGPQNGAFYKKKCVRGPRFGV